MNETELTSISILWAINDWMENQQQTVQEFLSYLAHGKHGMVSVEELRVGIEFMNLEDAPQPSQVQELASLLVPSSSQGEPAIDFNTLQMALVAVKLQKEKCNRAANCFMKDFSKMTRQESNAAIFFKELWQVLKYKSMTPLQLFSEFDSNKNGAILPAELT